MLAIVTGVLQRFLVLQRKYGNRNTHIAYIHAQFEYSGDGQAEQAHVIL